MRGAAFRRDFAALGYRAEVVGQKAYNGVAILSRHPFETRLGALPGLPEGDAQARYVEVASQGLVIGGLYLPNGNSGGEAGYAYKLAWMDRLRRARRGADGGRHAVPARRATTMSAPNDDDFAPGVLPPTDALVRPETRAAVPARCSGSACPTRCARCTRTARPTRSGTIRPDAGRATRGCASTT